MKRRDTLILFLIVVSMVVSVSFNVLAQGEINPLLIDPPDIVLVNGNIATVDDDFSFAEALAIRDNRILAVGTNDEMQSLVLDGTQVIDLGGRTVLPGLIDGHLHGIRNGYQCYLQAVRLETTFSRAEALEQYRAKAEELGPGRWIFTAGGWNVNQLDVPGMFTLAELDAVMPENPVSIAGTGAPRQVNSAALAAMGITNDTPDPQGGSFLRDDAGNLTGALQGASASSALINPAINFPQLTIEQQKDCLSAFLRDANMRGMTGWDDSNGNDPYDPELRTITVTRDNHAFQAVNQLWAEGRLTARVNLHMQNYEGNEETIRDTARSLTQFGDDMLHLAGVGEEPYGSGSGANTDGQDFDVDEFIQRYSQLTDYLAMNGIQFKHHSSSQFSNELYLTVWEATNAKYPIVDLNWSVDHPEDTTEEQLARFKALGVTVIPTDNQADNSGGPPLRRMYDSGVSMCIGSDAMNVAPWPPFVNLWFAVSGHALDPNEVGIAEDQLLTREEALRSMTEKCNQLMDRDGKIGSLQAGYFADVIVLSDDYFTVPVDDIRSLTSVLTIVDGRIVYADGDYAGLDA